MMWCDMRVRVSVRVSVRGGVSVYSVYTTGVCSLLLYYDAKSNNNVDLKADSIRRTTFFSYVRW